MSFRRNAPASRATAGFVLIEVLVAVGVAAVLMAVLIRSFSATWSGIGFVREEAEGTMLARSMLTDALQRKKLAPGSQEGVAGRYAWKLTTVVMPVRVAPTQKPRQPQQSQQTQPSQQAGQSRQAPQNNDNQAASASALYHVVLVLKGPSGRSNRLDAFEIGQPAQ